MPIPIPSRRPLRSTLARLLVLVPLVPLLALAACRGGEERAQPAAASSPAAGTPRRGGTAVLTTTADLGGVNELTVPTTTTNLAVHRLLYLRLLEEQPDFSAGPPTFTPLLARSYEFSPDHKTVTLKLREDLVWSDGVPVTAEDVRWTWQAQVDPDVAWSDAYFKRHIRDVEAVDPHTVRVHFDSAYATQLLDLNEGYIAPKHAWEKLPFSEWRKQPEFFQQHLVVSGPYTLAAWRPQQEIVLQRNPRYFEPGLPRLDRVVFRIVPLVTNQVTQLLAGTTDFLPQVPMAELARVSRSPKVRILPFWGRRMVFVMLNLKRPPFDDPEVRRALTLGTDREAIVEAIWGKYGRVAASPIVSTVWANDRSLKPLPYDPEGARKILAARGWRDSDGDGILDRKGQRFSFELLSNQGNAERQTGAVMIQEQLRKIGIEAKPRTVEFNSLIGQLEGHRFDASMFGIGIPTTLDLEYAFHTRSITEGSNYGSYSNPEVDRLIEEVRARRDLGEALPQLHRLQQIVYHDQPYIFLWESQELVGVSDRLQDVRPNGLFATFNLPEWWLKAGS
jgi:peptide/nickel transport system substrate-binding protein